MITKFIVGQRYFFDITKMKDTGDFKKSFFYEIQTFSWFLEQAEKEGFVVDRTDIITPTSKYIEVIFWYNNPDKSGFKFLKTTQTVSLDIFKYIYVKGESRFKQEEFEV